MLAQAVTTCRGVHYHPRYAREAVAPCYQAAGWVSGDRRCLVARPGLLTPQQARSQSLQCRRKLAQASAHAWSDGARTPEEVKQSIRQNFQDMGSSLEQQSPEVLYPLLSTLLEDGQEEAAAMVIDALLVSTPNDTNLIKRRAELEQAYEPQRALQSFSEFFKLGGGTASDYMSYGHLLLEENDGEAASAALSHALTICEPSEKFGMLVARACCKFEAGDQQGALNDLLEAEKLDQLDARPLIVLAELTVAFREVASAIAVLDRAALIEPLDAKTTEKRAAWKFDIADYAGAKADLDKVILLGLDNSLIYRNRGVANMQLGHFEAALADFNQAVEKQSDQEEYHEALVYRAAAKHSMGDLQDAIADWDTAEQIQPLADNDQARRQQCLKQLAESSPAMQQTMDAAEGLSTPDALYHKANMHMSTLKYRAALQELQTLRAIDITWDVVNVLRMCSVCNNKLGQHEDALADLDKAVEIDPRDVQILQERAVTKAALHDYEGGLADISTAIQLHPDANSFTRRGTVLCMLDRLEAALADLDKANELRPNHAYTLVWRGYVKNDQEDWAGAIADFDEAESLKPLDEHSLQLRAFAKEKLEMLGNADKADMSV